MSGFTYSEWEKARQLFATIGGKWTKIAKQTGIPATTLRREFDKNPDLWLKGYLDRQVSIVGTIRDAFGQKMLTDANKMADVQSEAFQRLAELIEPLMTRVENAVNSEETTALQIKQELTNLDAALRMGRQTSNFDSFLKARIAHAMAVARQLGANVPPTLEAITADINDPDDPVWGDLGGEVAESIKGFDLQRATRQEDELEGTLLPNKEELDSSVHDPDTIEAELAAEFAEGLPEPDTPRFIGRK